ncbi:acyltransferase [Litoribacillus peritrichatus]|uniref:Acyltransferase n=1 Tax=Litoribacillus peritrichatus TaxID=718191 RepID=A0ABP7MXL1_9GAMM
MLSFLPAHLKGIISSVLLLLNTLFWTPLLFTLAIIKLILPFQSVRRALDPFIIGIAESWIACNSGWMKLVQKLEYRVTGIENIKHEGWYLISSNHQSWSDITILQHIFNKRVPFFKFFLKQELIWVPIMGINWWALEFPFMKRYSKEFLEKNPHLKGKDMETTRQACEKYKHTPIAIFNFMEGTRFTKSKHERQNSPYKHLLKPKAGGAAFVLEAMDGLITRLVNITVVYDKDTPMDYWSFLCGKVNKATIHVEQIVIPPELLTGDYNNDPEFRADFQDWISAIWQEKDELIESIKNQQNTPQSEGLVKEIETA